MRSGNVGLFLMRITLAFIFLWNGIPKLLNPEMAISSFSGYGLAGFLGPIIGIISILAAIFVLSGFWFKLGNFFMFAIAFIAIVTVHIKEGINIGFERNVLIMATTIFLYFFGPGKLFLLRLNDK